MNFQIVTSGGVNITRDEWHQAKGAKRCTVLGSTNGQRFMINLRKNRLAAVRHEQSGKIVVVDARNHKDAREAVKTAIRALDLPMPEELAK